MFPVFPVLFPVCSQFPTHAFNVFLAFSVSAARAINAVSVFRFFAGGNAGNTENFIGSLAVAGSSWWNKRGTTGNSTSPAAGPRP